jgi:hypothetical protein
MKTSRSTLRFASPAALVLALGACTGIAAAQRVVSCEKILAVGDVPSWAQGGPVTEVDTPFVDAEGNVGFGGRIAPDGITQTFVYYGSTVRFLDTPAPSGYTLSGRESSMGISPGGEFIYSPSINGNDGLWSSRGYIIATRDVAPGVTGKYIKFASGPRMSAGGVYTFMAGYSNIPGGTTTDRALYRGRLGVPGMTLIYKTGDVIAGEVVRFATPNLSFRYDASDSGQHIIHLVGVGAGSTGTTLVLLDGAWIARPGNVMPGTPYLEAWNTFTGCGVNNSGEWIIFGDSSNYDEPISNGFINFNGVSTAHENQTIDGVTLTTPASVRVAAVNNLSKVAHMWTYGSASPAAKVLFVGDGADLGRSQRIVGSGDLLDFDGDGAGDFRVYDLPESVVAGPGIDLGDDGKVVTRISLEPLAGGTRFDAVVRFCYDHCSACPPCAADYNQDGGVDGADIASFFPDWEASASCADVNQDGGVDGSDIEAFFNVWAAGGC